MREDVEGAGNDVVTAGGEVNEGEVDLEVDIDKECESIARHDIRPQQTEVYGSVDDSGDSLDRSTCARMTEEENGWMPAPLLSYSSLYSHCLPTGLAWSSDGRHLAVTSDDACIRVFYPDLTTGAESDTTDTPVIIKETEYIYSFAWLPGSDKLAATGRYQPVHLWDLGQTHSPAATYKCINQLDELTHAFSVTTDGEKLYCGLKGEVRVFDVCRPGRESSAHRIGGGGQGGIVSCLALHPALPVYAAGCYNRTTGLYSRASGEQLCLLTGQRGGVTQVSFSQDGTKLFTGGRKDDEIVCWDLREPGKVVCALKREVSTNQRVQFCLSPCDSYLVSANTDGSVRVWDIARGQADPHSGVLAPQHAWLLHGDAVTGVGWQPGGATLASCSGQRHFSVGDSEGDSEEEESQQEERSVRLWNLS